MEISVGHTPDSDDAFMFYGMFTDKVPSPDFTVNHVIEDIENLNLKATNPELDVTAVSVHACAYIPGYTILRSGGSFGINYGPIVTAKKQMTIEELKKCKIAIPGKMTSPFLLLQLMIGKFEYVEMNFSDIPKLPPLLKIVYPGMYAHACTETAVTSNSGFVAFRFKFSISSIT